MYYLYERHTKYKDTENLKITRMEKGKPCLN